MNLHFSTKILLILSITLTSCASKPLTKSIKKLEPARMNLVGFDWLGALYRPDRAIRDSIVQKLGNQQGAWFYANVGNHQQSLATWTRGRTDTVRGLTPEESAAFSAYVPLDAHDFILDKAREHEILIINELHHVPQHRVFTTQLLRDLYRNGYRYLGLETLMNNWAADSILNAKKTPTLTSGVYSSEPQFGNLIRTALRLGFTIFSYEADEMSMKTPRDREIAQAKNIQNFLENQAKEGKTLIYCGGAHNTEGEMGGKWEKAMAQRLANNLGINPLTVSQIHYSEKGKKQFENKYFQAVDVKKPTVFVDETGCFGERGEKTGVDIYVFHPRTKSENRPEWLVYGNRKKVNLDLKNLKIPFPCLVLAYLERDLKAVGQPVPYDVQTANEANSPVQLVIEKGKYQILIVDAQGKQWKTWRRF